MKFLYVLSFLVGLLSTALAQGAAPPSGKALTKCESIGSSGHYYLANDVSCSKTPFGIDADHIVLNLNGHTVTFGSATAVVPAFAICDAWFTGLKGCRGGSHHASPEIYGGNIIEDADAMEFTPVFWIGEGNGLSGGKIHDLTATFGGVGAQFVHGDYPGIGWEIYNNVIHDKVTRIEHPGQSMLSARSQFQGEAIYLNDGTNLAGAGDRIHDNSIDGSPQGGIQTTARNSEIYNNTIVLSSSYSNDYGVTVLADGQRVHDNKISGRGRGLDGESSNFVFDHNIIAVHEEKNNAEYNGCELSGSDGIRIKNYSNPGTRWAVTNNTVEATATECPAVALRLTGLASTASGTISGNSFIAIAGTASNSPLSFEGDDRAALQFTGNTFSGSSVQIDWDGANELIQAGQTWKLTGTTVDDKDGQKAGAGDSGKFPQALTIGDSIPNPTVQCGDFAIAIVTIGSFTKHCGQ